MSHFLSLVFKSYCFMKLVFVHNFLGSSFLVESDCCKRKKRRSFLLELFENKFTCSFPYYLLNDFEPVPFFLLVNVCVPSPIHLLKSPSMVVFGDEAFGR